MTQNFTELKQEFHYVIYANFTEQELETIDLINFTDFEEAPDWLDIKVVTDSAQVAASKRYLLESPAKDNIVDESCSEVIKRSINAKHAIIVSGNVLNPANGLDNYIEVIIMLEIILASYADCIAILDLKTETLLARNEWLKQVVTNLSEDIFEITDHVLAIRTEEDNSIWLRTHGMVKFGKPELSFANIARVDEEDKLELLNDLAADLIYNNSLPAHNSKVSLDGEPQGLIALHQGEYLELEVITQ